MDILPYSIYVDKRPLRVAFLIGPDQLEFVDKVIDYNKDKWGGRFNPIIVTDGQVIDGKEWEFLKEYDPDIIKSLVDLSDELKKKIHIFLSPFSIEATLSKTDYVRLDGYPVSVLPHNTNVRMVSGGFFDDSPTIALFEFDETTPDILRRFIGRNFGYFEDGKMLSYPIKKALEGCQTKTYKITDLVSLNEALVDFGKFHFRVVFANQLCALPNNHLMAYCGIQSILNISMTSKSRNSVTPVAGSS